MRAEAEIQRMRELSDVWGVAVTVSAVQLIPSIDDKSGEADLSTLELIKLTPLQNLRETTQVVDRFLAEKYARRIRAAVTIMIHKLKDEAFTRGGPISVCVKELGPYLPHKMTLQNAQRLLVDIDKCVSEIKKRERGGVIFG